MGNEEEVLVATSQIVEDYRETMFRERLFIRANNIELDKGISDKLNQFGNDAVIDYRDYTQRRT